MPSLVKIEDVRRRLGLAQGVQTINQAIVEAANGVTEQLIEAVGTDFDHVVGRKEYFYVRDSLQEGGRFHVQLKLDRGLVDEATNAVRVRVTNRKVNFDLDDFTDLRDSSLNAAVRDADEFVMVRPEDGVVVIQDFRPLRQYVEVQYDAGISRDRTKPDDQYETSDSTRTVSSVEVTFDDAGTLTRTAGDWTSDLRVGESVTTTSTTNPGPFTITALSAPVITTSSTVVDEAATTIDVSTELKGSPSWLRELAELKTILELTASSAVGTEISNTVPGDRLRPEVLEAKVCGMLDRRARYFPSCQKAIASA